MGRHPRIHYRGALFHVIARGNGKQDVFLDDADRLEFTHRLGLVMASSGVALYAYCLMSNHIHLLVRVGDLSISEAMQRLLGGYSRHFNRKWERVGHVFEGRFKAIHCGRDHYFKELVRYINMNPVRAGIVDHPSDWPWSGYRETIGWAPERLLSVTEILAAFGGRRSLVDFVERGADVTLEALPEITPEASSPPPQAPSSPLRSIATRIALDHALVADSLSSASKIKPLSAARKDFIMAAAAAGYRPAEIARYLNRSEAAISRMASLELRRLRQVS